MRIELTILRNLIHNEDFVRKTLPFLKKEYFQDSSEREVFDRIQEFVTKYNSRPSREAIGLDIEANNKLSEEDHKRSMELVRELHEPEPTEMQWLLDSTEQFCQDRAIYNAIMDSIAILDGKDKNRTKNALPELLSEALGVSFDSHIGHDFLEDYEARFDFYHRKEERVPFDLEMFNTITLGGLPKKTMNILLAGCVHPNTKVRIRFRKNTVFMFMNDDFIEKEVSISEIKTLLDNGYEVHVDSPDGFVPVNFFINKGMFIEYILHMDNGKFIRCNESHLFETTLGWKSAEELCGKGDINFLTKNGYEKGYIIKTNDWIPIVDINVDHPNHRYYTENVSSHNTGVGKSLVMCHMAAANLDAGKNVLYITLEMAEEKIAERIDANLLNVATEDLVQLPRDIYEKKIQRLRAKTQGKLIIKEYPTASSHVGHFRHLLNELYLKRNFAPDVIYIDYLNICTSSRIKAGANVNSYSYVKAIAEELRGLAVEKNVPIVSATQTTRSGYTNSDPGLEDTSESFGLPATADFMVALIRTEELDELGQLMVKQLKNRYSDPSMNKRFMIGLDRTKMRLFDAEDTAQDGLVKDSPVMDNTTFGMEENERSKPKPKYSKFKF